MCGVWCKCICGRISPPRTYFVRYLLFVQKISAGEAIIMCVCIWLAQCAFVWCSLCWMLYATSSLIWSSVYFLDTTTVKELMWSSYAASSGRTALFLYINVYLPKQYTPDAGSNVVSESIPVAWRVQTPILSMASLTLCYVRDSGTLPFLELVHTNQHDTHDTRYVTTDSPLRFFSALVSWHQCFTHANARKHTRHTHTSTQKHHSFQTHTVAHNQRSITNSSRVWSHTDRLYPLHGNSNRLAIGVPKNRSAISPRTIAGVLVSREWVVNASRLMRYACDRSLAVHGSRDQHTSPEWGFRKRRARADRPMLDGRVTLIASGFSFSMEPRRSCARPTRDDARTHAHRFACCVYMCCTHAWCVCVEDVYMLVCAFVYEDEKLPTSPSRTRQIYLYGVYQVTQVNIMGFWL